MTEPLQLVSTITRKIHTQYTKDFARAARHIHMRTFNNHHSNVFPEVSWGADQKERYLPFSLHYIYKFTALLRSGRKRAGHLSTPSQNLHFLSIGCRQSEWSACTRLQVEQRSGGALAEERRSCWALPKSYTNTAQSKSPNASDSRSNNLKYRYAVMAVS